MTDPTQPIAKINPQVLSIFAITPTTVLVDDPVALVDDPISLTGSQVAAIPTMRKAIISTTPKASISRRR